MSATQTPTRPFGAVDSPPEKENARPGEPGTGSSGERLKDDTGNPDGQARESGFAAICKAWMRCGPTDRALFLADVRAGCPNLWRSIDRDALRR